MFTKEANIFVIDSIKHEPIIGSCQDVQDHTVMNYDSWSQN